MKHSCAANHSGEIVNAAHTVSLTVACSSRSVAVRGAGRGGEAGVGASSSSMSSSENVRRCRRPDPRASRASPPNPPSPPSPPTRASPVVVVAVANSSPSNPVSLCHPPRPSAPQPRHSLSPMSIHSFRKYAGSSTTNSALHMNVSSSGDRPWPSSDSTRKDPPTQITHTARMKA